MIRKIIFIIYLVSVLSSSYGNTIILSGDLSLPIKRSLASNWSSDSTTTLTVENTDTKLYKIVVEGSSFFASQWHNRSLRVSPVNFNNWQAIHPPITYQMVTLVNNGIINGPQDFIWTINTGNYPALNIKYEARANMGADTGAVPISIIYTFIEQF